VCFGEWVSCLDEITSLSWKDAAGIEAAITQKIPELLALDQAYQNARECSDPQNTRIEGELAVQRAISVILSDYIELFQQFTQDSEFREKLTSFVLTVANDLRPS